MLYLSNKPTNNFKFSVFGLNACRVCSDDNATVRIRYHKNAAEKDVIPPRQICLLARLRERITVKTGQLCW